MVNCNALTSAKTTILIYVPHFVAIAGDPGAENRFGCLMCPTDRFKSNHSPEFRVANGDNLEVDFADLYEAYRFRK